MNLEFFFAISYKKYWLSSFAIAIFQEMQLSKITFDGSLIIFAISRRSTFNSFCPSSLISKPIDFAISVSDSLLSFLHLDNFKYEFLKF